MDLYLSYVLTTLIIGILILILLEWKKKGKEETEEAQKPALRNTEVNDTKTEVGTEIEVVTKEVIQDNVTTTTTTNTSSSCSSSEEDTSKPVKVSRKPKKKHACKGSAIVCATKRKVTAVTIVTDSEERDVQVSLEELAGEMRKNGVTCNVHPALAHLLPSISTEPSHLLLLFGTTSKGCEGLQECLKTALGGDSALPPPQPFLYSVTCWSEAATGDVFESSLKLGASLASYGGAEWLPITCITTTHTDPSPPVMTSQQYLTTVMDKITKPGKKCCGTSCGTKTIDIEDLASSLLLPRTAVTS